MGTTSCDPLLGEFYKTPDNTPEKVKSALDRAYNIRQFEIELYWKRATYFWGFLVAIFAGYFGVINSDSFKDNKILAFYLICVGFIFSQGWYLVNRGRKYWQENWERLIIGLEEPALYGISLEDRNKRSQLLESHNFSVSRINQLISLFVSFFWLVLGLTFLFSYYESSYSGDWWLIPLVIIVTLIFVVVLWCEGHSKSDEKEKESYSFKINNLEYKAREEPTQRHRTSKKENENDQ